MDFWLVKFRRSLLIALMLFQTSALAVLATDDAAITEEQVMKAIDVMMTKPLSDEMAKAPKVVTEFADKSDKVTVLIRPEFYKPIDPKGSKFELLMLSYYIAGSVKYQLQHPKAANIEAPSVTAGLRASLFIYDIVRKKRPEYHVELYDNLQSLEQQGKLDEYVNTVLKKK